MFEALFGELRRDVRMEKQDARSLREARDARATQADFALMRGRVF